MKRIAVPSICLALSLPFAAAADRPSTAPRAASSICDGDFERGPDGGCWVVSANEACEWILNPTSIWGIAAHSGFYTYWAGGYCAGRPNNSSLHQTVTVPEGTTSLDLYTVLYRPSPDDTDADTIDVQLGFKVVGTIPMTQANDTYPSWVLQSFPVPPAAWGATVALKIKGRSLGLLTGNALVDDVDF